MRFSPAGPLALVLLGAISVVSPASAQGGDVYLPVIIADSTATPMVTPTPTGTQTPTGTPAPTVQPAQAFSAVCADNAYNCADFPTQWQVQVGYDVYRLGGDYDGVAYESLP